VVPVLDRDTKVDVVCSATGPEAVDMDHDEVPGSGAGDKILAARIVRDRIEDLKNPNDRRI